MSRVSTANIPVNIDVVADTFKNPAYATPEYVGIIINLLLMLKSAFVPSNQGNIYSDQ